MKTPTATTPPAPTWAVSYVVASTGKRYATVLCKPCAQKLNRDHAVSIVAKSMWPCNVCRREGR